MLSLVVLIQLNMSQFDAADVLFVTGSRYSVCCNDKETGDVLFSLTAVFSADELRSVPSDKVGPLVEVTVLTEKQ